MAGQVEFEVSRGSVVTAARRHGAEADALQVGDAGHGHFEALAVHVAAHKLRTDHHGVAHIAEFLREINHHRDVAHLRSVDFLEVSLEGEGKVVTHHHGSRVGREGGVLARIVEFALVEIGDEGILHHGEFAALHGHGVLDIVDSFGQAGLAESGEMVDGVEEITLAHADQRVSAVVQPSEQEFGCFIAALLHESAAGVVEHGADSAVFRLSEVRTDAAELDEREGRFGTERLIERSFHRHGLESTVLARGRNAQHVAFVHLFEQHELGVLHAKLRDVSLLRDVVDGVGNVLRV